MTVLARTILFLSAYTPAFVLLALRAWGSNAVLATGFAVLAAVSTVGLAVLVTVLRRASVREVTVEAAEGRSEGVAAFLVGYVLPFVVTDYRDTFTVAALVLFFAMVGVVYVRMHLVHLNPVLAMAGYAVWRAQVAGLHGGEPDVVVIIVDDPDLRVGATLWLHATDSAVQLASRGPARG